MYLLLLLILMWSFNLCCGEAFHFVFRSLSKGNDPNVAADLVFTWEKVSLGSFYAPILLKYPHVAHISIPLANESLTALCSILLFQGCSPGKQPWKAGIMSLQS